MGRGLFQPSPNGVDDRLLIGERSRLEFRVNQVTIGGDFETSARAGLEFQRADLLLVGRKNLLRQTDGFGFVVSDRAVFEVDLHGDSSGCVSARRSRPTGSRSADETPYFLVFFLADLVAFFALAVAVFLAVPFFAGDLAFFFALPPKAASQPAAYFRLVPTRTIVTVRHSKMTGYVCIDNTGRTMPRFSTISFGDGVPPRARPCLEAGEPAGNDEGVTQSDSQESEASRQNADGQGPRNAREPHSSSLRLRVFARGFASAG